MAVLALGGAFAADDVPVPIGKGVMPPRVLSKGDPEYSREARAKTAGAANSAQFWSMSAPMALCSSFAPLVAEAIARRRSTGSATSVDREVKKAETWLLPSASESSERTETGQTAISGVPGSSPRRMRYRRRAPAHVASTTSLTVVPKLRFTSLISGRERFATATFRWGVTEPLKEVRGAVNGAAMPAPCPRRRARTTLATERAVPRRARARSRGWRARERTA